MRYQVIICGPASGIPSPEFIAGTHTKTDVVALAHTDDLELAWLTVNWAQEHRLCPGELIGVWDIKLNKWLVPDQVKAE